MKNIETKKITRREAIEKAGKYAAITAATFLILSPKQSQADSPADPGWGNNISPKPIKKQEENKANLA